MEQLSFFPQKPDPRPPETITWNLWHGCTKVSSGCKHCYMYRRDEEIGKDPTIVRKTQAFHLPTRRLKAGQFKGLYKIPSGSRIFTCFSSDFFHPDADVWRNDAWDMMRERTDCSFFMITKRPERIAASLPPDWETGWEHVVIAVTCEDQRAADKRLPVYLSLPLRHYAVMIEPMLTQVNLRPYFRKYRNPDGTPLIEEVSCGGESGPDARVCDYSWVLGIHLQCVEHGISFSFHQTGAKLKKADKVYEIPREFQHEQARKAHLDFDGKTLIDIPFDEK